LSLTKPDPAIYHKAIDILGHRPEECVMVAAHAYDLEAAKKVYVHIALLCNIHHCFRHRTDETLGACVQCMFNAGVRTCQVLLKAAGKIFIRLYVRLTMHSLMDG
jgi:beta-phosphoglucomutase-like phosphatase (HAD superfamily)